MDIRLIAVDLDGTLFDTQKKLSEGNRHACEEAIEAGVQVVIATGRPFYGIPAEARKLRGLKYAICTNGASLYDLEQEKCLYEDPMPRNETLAMMEGLMKMPVICDVFYEGHAYIDSSKTGLIDRMNTDEPFKVYFRSCREEVPDVMALMRSHARGSEKVTVNFTARPDGTPFYRQEALDWCAQFHDLVMVSGGVGNAEFTKASATKGAALLKLAEIMGIKPQQTMAIGDSGNDFDMLQKAGFSVGMANSEPEILEIVDYVTKSNNEDGVAYAVRKFALP
ncbi:MAG: Cof-type HAD-IIB family hydrolase [Lachnospiraceae bacterium]|nr:Cof-type HAD-IIB family hydrolase [Lachnospiraceae bacterium]